MQSKELTVQELYKPTTRYKKFTDIQIQNYIEAHKSGNSVRALAKIAGIKKETLTKYMIQFGYTPTIKTKIDLRINKLESALNIYLNSNKTIDVKTLAKEIDVAPESLSAYIKSKNHTVGRVNDNIILEYNDLVNYLNTYPQKNNITNHPCKGNVKVNPFYPINTDAAQYWLGYLAGDGCLTTQKRNGYYISVTSTDEETVLNYIDFVKTKICCSKRNKNLFKNKGKCKDAYTLTFANRNIFEYLLDCGITPKKSLNLSLNIPLSFPFLRGLIDSDGCITVKNKTSSSLCISIVTASKTFCKQIFKFLKENGIESTISESNSSRDNTLYSVRIHNKINILRMYSYMYNDLTTYYLSRKKNIYNRLLNNT